MSLFSIDEAACRRDGLCARLCPLGVLRHEHGEVPREDEARAQRCIRCGHCVAVCRAGAIRFNDPARAARPLRRELLPGPEQVAELLASRRSVRFFKEEPAPGELILRALDTARCAPSGHNAQPVRWVYLENRAAVERAASLTADWMASMAAGKRDEAARMHLGAVAHAFREGRDVICRGAPQLVCAVTPVEGITPEDDAVIALTFLDIAATSLGLGTCWAGYVAFAARGHAPLREFLGVGAGEALRGALMLGLPAVRFFAVPPREPLRLTTIAG